MSKQHPIGTVKSAAVVAAALALTVSVGPASATSLAAVAGPAGAAAPAGTAIDTADRAVAAGASAAVVGPASYRPARPATRPSRASAQRTRVVKQSRFSAYTLRSKATRDMRGVEASLYRGRYFSKTAETKRECIVRRESSGHYDAVSRGGTYRGAYQVSAALARGATWMMLREHKPLMGTENAKRTMARLRATPMNRWPRYWQDAAFHTIIDYRGTLSGAKHWAGGRWHC